ncbi:hypothetical protein EBU94_01295 [bacterium]|nr:hypothetical protein [bacterium]
MNLGRDMAGSFQRKLPASTSFRKEYEMFLEPSCIVVGIDNDSSNSKLNYYRSQNTKAIRIKGGILVFLWESIFFKPKSKIEIPQNFEGEIFLGAHEFGKLSIEPYGEAQVVADLDGNSMNVTVREENKFLFVTNDGEIASINCTTTAGGKEISIFEYYLTENDGSHFISRKLIFSNTLEFVDYESFGIYAKAVSAVVDKAACFKCNHCHFGEI